LPPLPVVAIHEEVKSKIYLTLFLVVIALIIAAFVSIKYYPFVFAKEVKGLVVRVERVTQPSVIMGNPNAAQVFSFAVAIKDEKGEIHTASTEDRQWAVVQAGQCAVAKFYPYPFWELDKAGTYHGARLMRLSDCPPGLANSMPQNNVQEAAPPVEAVPPPPVPVETAAPPVPAPAGQ
jgi:hypothetical protein